MSYVSHRSNGPSLSLSHRLQAAAFYSRSSAVGAPDGSTTDTGAACYVNSVSASYCIRHSVTGFLTGTIRSIDQFDADDFRATNPRFTGENFQRNLAVADEVKAVDDEVGATPAQVAIAWLLTKDTDTAPIPGTKRVSRLEENIAADDVVLTAAQLTRLDELTPAAGGHHTDEQMAMIER